MSRRLIATGAILLAALPGAALEARSASPSPAAAVAGEASPQAVQSLLDSYVASGKAPGIVVAIGWGDAPPVFIHAGKISDDTGAPDTGPDSLWRIYSMTKPITAIAAMMLVEQGKIGLDQPVSDFIPAFKSVRVLDAPETSLASHPAGRPVTVRHLLTHSGGLAYQFLVSGPVRKEYERLGLLGGRADAVASKVQPATLAEFADRVASVPLLAEPGTRWNYSVGVDVLGRVIEVASGEPFDRFVQARVLKPLGMTSTYWTVPQSETARLSTAYAWAGERRVPIDAGATTDWLHPPRLPYGGSGLVSSARDYDRLLRMLAGHGSLGKVHLLRPETVRLALSNLLPEGVHVVANGTPDTALAEGFGAGGWVYLADVPHGVSAGTYGWFGAAGTIAFLDPAKGLRVTVMTNYFPANKWPLYGDVVKSLYSSQK
ncbi:serine hydrolase domain-containing protein [Sphingomonas sp. ZT3P38]|uniref:serine hydrolase domain-containing protein n=1 Tax=Parasphingomonas zepuensis TaxID=3096161 RepID=UPI002FC638A1